MYRSRNLRNNEKWEDGDRFAVINDSYSRQYARDLLEEQEHQARDAFHQALCKIWETRLDPVNGKKKKRTKGRKSLNKRDRLH